MAILLAFIPGIFGFLGLGHFFSRKFRLGFIYLSIGILTFFVVFLFSFIINNMILMIVIFIGYVILWIWQIYDAKSLAIKYNLENMTQYLRNNNNNKDKISIEVEFPKITYHNIGLSLIERISKNRISAFYATISMYSMPAITALALFLMVGSTIILIQDETAREGVRELGIDSNAIDPSNPLIPWESDISIGAISFFSSIVVSQFGRAIIAKIYSIRIQSLGLTTILGIIPTNPFIELNKDDTSKLPLKKKSTLFSADPLSNILLSLLSFGFLYLLVSSLSPIPNDSADKAGITVLTVGENSLAKSIGLEKNSTITFINNEPIEDGDELRNILRDNLGTTVQIKWMTEDNKEQIQSVNLPTSVPENKGVLGITFTDTYFDPVLVLDNYKNLFLTNPLAILMPPTLQKNLVPYSDVMSSQYTSSIFGSSFPIIANLLFWIWFINFNFGIFKSLPITYLPGGSLYNSIIEYKLKNKPKWIVRGITISLSIIMVLYAYSLTNNYLANWLK